MRIDIAWSDNAIALLDNIYRFYSKKSQTAAIRLYNRLLDSAEPLRIFPQAGDIYVDSTVEHINFIAPDAGEDIFA